MGAVRSLDGHHPVTGEVRSLGGRHPVTGEVRSLGGRHPVTGEVRSLGGRHQAMGEVHPLGGHCRAMGAVHPLGDHCRAMGESHPLGGYCRATGEVRPLGGRCRAKGEVRPLGGRRRSRPARNGASPARTRLPSHPSVQPSGKRPGPAPFRETRRAGLRDGPYPRRGGWARAGAWQFAPADHPRFIRTNSNQTCGATIAREHDAERSGALPPLVKGGGTSDLIARRPLVQSDPTEGIERSKFLTALIHLEWPESDADPQMTGQPAPTNSPLGLSRHLQPVPHAPWRGGLTGRRDSTLTLRKTDRNGFKRRDS